jgi:hypothetical protein
MDPPASILLCLQSQAVRLVEPNKNPLHGIGSKPGAGYRGKTVRLFYSLEVMLTKKILTIFVLLLALCYGLTWLLPGEKSVAEPTITPSSVATVPATQTVQVCNVKTGIDEGQVNLRKCEGTACPVLLVLEEGQALTILHAGSWNEVLTKDGMRGWVNSKYCKGK